MNPPPPIFPDESARLAALQQLGLLDTPPEERFDRITRLASRLLNMPIALVSLVDKERQWFKSAVGLEAPETPRSVSFCAHTLGSKDFFEVPDATQDARFAENPLVTGEPQIRYYAAHPLAAKASPESPRVGTLCVIDRQPRRLTPDERELLQELAALAEEELQVVARADALRELALERGIAARERAKYEALVAHMPSVVFMKSREGRMVYMNQRGIDLFQRNPVGCLDAEWLPADVAAITIANDSEVWRTGEPLEVVEIVPTQDGKVTDWLVAKFLVHSGTGDEPMLGGVAVDITEQRRAERRLQELAESLRDAHAAAEAARQAAENASQAKGQFLANMSHEIRTPLHGIIGLAGMMLEKSLAPDVQPLAETIHSAGQALLCVLNGILDFSKVEAGKMELHHADFVLPDVLEDLRRLHAVRANEKGVGIEVDISPEVPRSLLGDADRLRQVLSNLMSNAIKFSSRGNVRVEVSAVPEKNPTQSIRLRFAVQDQGIGIDATALARIFEPFTQADNSTTRNFGGTGLGLTISRQIVRLMDGELNVESEMGVGSTFHFTAKLQPVAALPLKGEPPLQTFGEAARALSHAASAQRPLRLLLAEDSRVNRMLAVHHLSPLRCSVEAVEDGRKAVDAVTATLANNEEPFDVILMDCQMPVMDGYAATAEIRRIEAAQSAAGGRSAHLRIIALTANAMEGERERCLAAGMDDYLSKPFSPEQLRAVVTTIATTTSAEEENQHIGSREMSELGGPMLRRLLEVFSAEGPATLSDMDAAVSWDDCGLLTASAHKLKGAAGNFGAVRLQKMCVAVEDHCRSGEARHARWLLRDLRRELGDVLGALNAEVARHKALPN